MASFDQAFAALRGGVAFDRRVNGRAMRIFQPTSTPLAPALPEPMSLNGGSGSMTNSTKKLARTPADSDEDADEDAEDSDGDRSDQSEPRDVPAGASEASLQHRIDAHTRAAQAVEETNLLKKQFGIKTSGGEAPPPLCSFKELRTKFKCQDWLLESLSKGGFGQPTPIQRQAIPALLKGAELMAIAPTGSGKTLAFLLPIVMTLKSHEAGGPRALLLCPTRELASQTTRVLRQILAERKKLLRTSVVTKANMGSVDYRQVDVLLANPLRLKTLIEGRRVDLSRVRFLVMDEADKLFEMGFVEQIDAAVGACSHPDIQRCLFSATLPETVEELARSVMPAPLRITVGERNTASATVSQRLVFVGQEEGKLMAVRQLVRSGEMQPPSIIFLHSKDRAKALYEELKYDGIRVGAIHADMSASKRSDAVDRFRAGETWFLIATDLMARGVDFVGINSVLNFDFPDSAITYIHRVGRTGRAGHSGHAVTLFTEDDSCNLKTIVNVMRSSGCDVPDWMLTLKKGPKHRKKKSEGLLDDDDNRNHEKVPVRPTKTKKGGEEGSRQTSNGKGKRKRQGPTNPDGCAKGNKNEAKLKAKDPEGFSTVSLYDVRQRQKKREMIQASKKRSRQ